MSQSLVHGYGRKYLTSRCLIKVDIRKAFDSLQWSFIQDILKALKFPEMGDVPSVSAVLVVLKNFSAWSGIYANTDKTEIYFGGVSDAIKQHILQDTGFSEGNFPFRYLGLPLNTARLTVNSYGVLIKKIQSFLQQWATRFFSYAGKVQLINSVIFGLTNFWCATALLPKNIIKNLNKLCKDFFLSIEAGQRRLVFKIWKSICSPWQKGGLNIKEFLSWNKALLAKWIWILEVKKSGLWYEWTQAYHLNNSSIWTLQSKSHYTESFRSLLIIRDEILAKTGSITTVISLISSWFHKGKFSIGRAYSWFRNSLPKLHWTTTLHHQFIIPSHSVITSLALQHKLAILDNLAGKGLHIINRCILCKQDNETHAHLFFNCAFSRQI
ncbi:uncharacterized protein LOC141589881 [Silene latifolia]|uniref:uncharacterized protein LOC141589881 n=1 Tax=Silene latifolia TaxID=37657 RepID=UPI003D771F06